jgi:pimeloyl-ACP methyl ester carboxylesterase
MKTQGMELFRAGTGAPVIAAAHPSSVFGAPTAELLSGIAGTEAICFNPRGLGSSDPAADLPLEEMVEDLESARRALGLDRWLFWGTSGGGWLAQLYARRFPKALSGIIVESACACFRVRLADPSCALSPFFPAWRAGLTARGLLREDSHGSAAPADDMEWIDVEGVGQVWRRRKGPALLVSPAPIDADMTRAMPRLWRFDARGWLGEVKVPALVIAGSADPVVPVAQVRAVHAALKGSTFVEVDGGGHVPSAEHRPVAAAAVRELIARSV